MTRAYQRSTRVTSLSLVRYRRNDYSVPTASGHRAVVVKGDVDEVVIVCGSEEIARHRRSYDRDQVDLRSAALLPGLLGAQDRGARPSGAPGRVGAAGGVCFGCGGSWRRDWVSRARGKYVQVHNKAAYCCSGKSRPDLASARPRPRRRPGRPHPVPRATRDRLRRRQASDAVPHRTPATPARSGAGLTASAGRARGDDRGGGALPGAAGGGHRVMATSTLLLDAHLKALRLPTFLREVRQSGAASQRPRRAGLSATTLIALVFRLCEVLQRWLDRRSSAHLL